MELGPGEVLPGHFFPPVSIAGTTFSTRVWTDCETHVLSVQVFLIRHEL